MLARSREDKVFDAVNITLLSILTLLVAYPLYFVVIASFSGPAAVNFGEVLLLPKDINFTGYSFVFKDKSLWHGYMVTIVLTLVGTAVNLALTFTGAYALTKTALPGIRVLMFLITFTMFFGGGMVPTYILVSSLHLRNTLWAMILPGAVSVYNLILVRTYYMKSIPEEIMDAARIDGCSDFKLFLRIALPLSAPIIATMALFYGVGHWNQFFAALIYISDKNLFPLQLVLRNMLLASKTAMTDMIQGGAMTGDNARYLSELMQRAEILKYAVIIVSTLPILMVYPFLQKYFMRGIMAGSLKG
ncbi:MAG: carbohydrate ABC transporter permease [Provencibacterium sp.]|jgi:putative aldouronate transport system permease protein|nr:carbohydrate ABC transporter permease [Provencibacterium sp.]